jgi:hypothetical protein
MPKTLAKSKLSNSKKKDTASQSPKQELEKQEKILNQLIQNEIARISELHAVDSSVLDAFAYFVIKNYKKPDPKPPSLAQLKAAVYGYFGVKNTTELKRSSSFKMATDGMGDLNLGTKESWEILHRKFVGILPHERNQQGYGCINGINIFNYFKPWEVFGLNPKTATEEEVKTAYHNLSKIYHPDIPKTGNAQIFDRLNTMYKSIAAKA